MQSPSTDPSDFEAATPTFDLIADYFDTRLAAIELEFSTCESRERADELLQEHRIVTALLERLAAAISRAATFAGLTRH